MTPAEFILSDRSRTRFIRHAVLWALFMIYVFIVNFVPNHPSDFTNQKMYAAAFYKLMYIPVSVLSAYVTAYFLLPRFILTGKYFSFAILFICLCGLNLFNAFWMTKLYVLLTQKVAFQQLPIQIRIFQPIVYGLGLGTAAGVFAGVVRLLKIHFLEQKENERLEKLKIITELEIIKTHFHPHFLTEALRSISHLIRTRSPEAPGSILKLADLLSYFLYENEKEKVLLEKEMQMVTDYLKLEQIFYGDRIVVRLKGLEEVSNIQIAPLILVSIVQHCCEQSLLSLQQKLVVEIFLKTQNSQLEFSLHCNGYYENINGSLHQNAGLNQSIKRVEMLYPGKSKLETQLNNGMFSLRLFLESESTPPTAIDNAEANLEYVSP